MPIRVVKISQLPRKVSSMTPKEAIKILMLSPCYWLLDVRARKKLVNEFCATYDAAATGRQENKHSQLRAAG